MWLGLKIFLLLSALFHHTNFALHNLERREKNFDICIQNLHKLSLYKSTVPSVGLVECVTMGTFKGGGTGVLEGRSPSLMTTGAETFAETTPLFCCVTALTLLVLFSSDGGGTSITSVVALESNLLASLSSEVKPLALSCSSL